MGRICPGCGKPVGQGAAHKCGKQAKVFQAKRKNQNTKPRKREKRTRAQEAERNRREPWRHEYNAAYRENRNRVIQRTGGRCFLCGAQVYIRTTRGWRKAARDFGGVHHRIPLSRGGTNDIGNLILLCAKCHGEAHSR